MRILIDPFDKAEQESRQSGLWIVAVVETRVSWPTKKQSITYAGRDFILMPAERNGQSGGLPAIAIRADRYELSREHARRELMKLASALSWSNGAKVEIVGWAGGNLPRSIGLSKNNVVTKFLECEHLPLPESEAANSALAFYREGVSLDNPFYSFLSLYKAFSRAVPVQSERTPWINGAVARLRENRAKERASELASQNHDVGTYLYGRCRNAVAHADREPFVNPDDTDDHFRLSKDVPLMKELTEIAIEDRLAVKRDHTIWKDHLYELAGFRDLIPENVRLALASGSEPSQESTIEIPDKLFVLARRDNATYPLAEMSAIAGHIVHGGLTIDLASTLDVCRLRVFLDFENERLEFDPVGGFALRSERVNEGNIREELAGLRFQRCILLNGHIEIWSADGNTRLGCGQTYIPKNCMVNSEFFEAAEMELTKLLPPHANS
jgi:hypothetical protein